MQQVRAEGGALACLHGSYHVHRAVAHSTTCQVGLLDSPCLQAIRYGVHRACTEWIFPVLAPCMR